MENTNADRAHSVGEKKKKKILKKEKKWGERKVDQGQSIGRYLRRKNPSEDASALVYKE